ncbi:hypothetical protein GW17_00024739 [Ensete ventricosum]|nr:hypothetical protein GW17_00024739 [Ensete ventricosum]
MTGNFMEFKADNQVRDSWNEQSAMTSTAVLAATVASNDSGSGSGSGKRQRQPREMSMAESRVRLGLRKSQAGGGKLISVC